MTTVEGCVNGLDPSFDDLPPWKRELILRKRANVKIHGGSTVLHGLPPSYNNPPTSLTAPQQPPQPRSLRGRSLSSSSSLQGSVDSLRSLNTSVQRSFSGANHHSKQSSSYSTVSSNSDGSEVRRLYSGSAKYYNNDIANGHSLVRKAHSVSSDMHHKGLYDSSGTGVGLSPEDEDLSYGPGIVSKLKNRYLSLAMRETRSRPALRKFSSLEDLLDADDGDTTWGDRSKEPPKIRRPAAPTGRRDAMKRTRSMDSLALRNRDNDCNIPKSKSANSRLNNSVASTLGKEDIIIIERPPVEAPCQKIEDRPFSNNSFISDLPHLTRKPSLAEEEELPAPDTVKQVKQLFEVRQVRGTAAKVAVFKANQAKANGVSPGSKPALKVKPAGLQPRKNFPSSPPIHQEIDIAKTKLRQVPQVTRPSPRSTLAPRPPSSPSVYMPSEAVTGLTPVTASVTAPLVNGPGYGHHEDGAKKVTSDALSNIRNDSSCQEFNFTSQSQRSISPTPKTLPPSPVPAHKVNIPSAFKGSPSETQRVQHENWKNSEKSKPTHDPKPPSRLESKQTNSNVSSNLRSPRGPCEPQRPKCEPPKPPVSNLRTSETVNKNIKSESYEIEIPKSNPIKSILPESNSVKESLKKSSPTSGRSEIIEAINKPATSKDPKLSSSSPGLRDKWHQQENTSLVFNFLDKKDTPDYIEDDGIIKTKRRPKVLDSGYVIMPGYEGVNDSSTDGDDLGIDCPDALHPGVTPPPSGIVFSGEAVIINGRSNLQRQPKNRKLNISFNDSATSTYEYPSETSLLENIGLSDTLSPEHIIDPSSSSSVLSSSQSQGGLANYTPSKFQLDDKFELGISRTTAPSTPPSSIEKRVLEDSPPDYVRPADEEETKPWSLEETSDMLF